MSGREEPEPGTDPYTLAERAADRLRALTGVLRHEVAVVLGSGWTLAVDALGETVAEVPFDDLPGFADPATAGHPGLARSVRAGRRHVLVLAGRTHFYEHRDAVTTAHPVRTAAAAGARVLVLTNGAGGLRREWAAGTPVLLRDQLNLTGASPLSGARFVDLTEVYSSRLRELCRALDPTLDEGVYAQVGGPQYETPAEIRMLATLGADLVGMSTALEAIAAREAALEVLGVSLVTNAAAGIGSGPLDHAEVLATGRAAAGRIGSLLNQVLPEL